MSRLKKLFKTRDEYEALIQDLDRIEIKSPFEEAAIADLIKIAKTKPFKKDQSTVDEILKLGTEFASMHDVKPPNEVLARNGKWLININGEAWGTYNTLEELLEAIPHWIENLKKHREMERDR